MLNIFEQSISALLSTWYWTESSTTHQYNRV